MSSPRHTESPPAPPDTDPPLVEPETTRALDRIPDHVDPTTNVLRSILAPSQAEGELGRIGHYRVLEVLGQGGMGLVCRAEDTLLERVVALKLIRPDLAQRPEVQQRFIREAKAVAALEHDHVVSIYQVGEHKGVPYLAMPLLRGETLEERLRRQGKLAVVEVLRVGKEIALGLAAAHERGLIHRDIKPANVFLETDRDRVKLLDFGLARGSAETETVTRPDMIVGTPSYMAPEQGRADATAVTARADLFSLGVVLYRSSVGVLPFIGEDAISTLVAIFQDEPTPPHQRDPIVPKALSDLIMSLLSKDAAARPESARLVAEKLARWEAKAYQQFAEHSRRANATPKPAMPMAEAELDEPKTLLRRELVPALVLALLSASVVTMGAVSVGWALTRPRRRGRASDS